MAEGRYCGGTVGGTVEGLTVRRYFGGWVSARVTCTAQYLSRIKNACSLENRRA